MSSDDDKVHMQRYYDAVWNKGNLSAIDELVAKDYEHLDPSNESTFRSPSKLKVYVARIRQTFPDMPITIVAQIAERDKAVTHWVMEGTHTGTLGPIPSTGRTTRFPGVSIVRIAGGRIVEDWTIDDRLTIMQQLGVLPAVG